MAKVRNRSLLFYQLRKMYLAALVFLISTLILSQIIMQYSIHLSDHDSHLINIAGRQRMLSQQISKSALAIYSSTNVSRRNLF